jgi:citrate synthase
VPEADRARGTVGALMSAPPVTATPGESVADAAARMGERKVGSVVVTDGDRPVGILTERDLVRVAGGGIDPSAATVADWMTADPDVVGPDEPVGRAFHALSKGGYRHFPVVEDGRVVGVVSIRDLLRVARIEPVTSPGHLEAPKGLEGVIVAETEIGDVRGEEGFYHYRQHSAVELAEKRNLEDVWHLLFHGHLPSEEERERFVAAVRPLREIPDDVAAELPAIARTGKDFVPLDALRTAVSLTAQSLGLRPTIDVDADDLRQDALRICAVTPTLIMALWRLRNGREPVPPHPGLPYAANYLFMRTGQKPKPDQARAVEQYLISTIDHGFNASTFSARVITSTAADLGSAVVGAIGALSGPLHGGAPSRALEMLEVIRTPQNAERYVREALEKGERIMGFGHRVYKTEDPRSRMLKGIAQRLGGEKAELALSIEQTIVDTLAELKPGRQLYANVEFYAGVVMDACGLPEELFTPTFTASRMIGWCANVLEQAADNRLIRPKARYVGPEAPQPVPSSYSSGSRTRHTPLMQ